MLTNVPVVQSLAFVAAITNTVSVLAVQLEPQTNAQLVALCLGYFATIASAAAAIYARRVKTRKHSRRRKPAIQEREGVNIK